MITNCMFCGEEIDAEPTRIDVSKSETKPTYIDGYQCECGECGAIYLKPESNRRTIVYNYPDLELLRGIY